MDPIERDVMRTLVNDLVEEMRRWAVPPDAIAAALGGQLAPADFEDLKTDAQMWAAVERRVTEARAANDVLVSCARAAQLTAMTRQGITWHVKHGNLPAVKLRVAGRSRLGIPLTSLCEYFDIAPQRRAELTADLPRDAAGNIDTVFWDWVETPLHSEDAPAMPAVVTRETWPRTGKLAAVAPEEPSALVAPR